MDITPSISHLLYYHDCVIVPGFGGFVCRFRTAQIHPVLNTIAPPSKAISFNINLRSADGLLADAVAKARRCTYQEASLAIEKWVTASVAVLNTQKELKLQGIGRLVQNIEGGWQFEQDEAVNYLPSSFGLPVITALPISRGREVVFETAVNKTTAPTISRWNTTRIAASVLLLAAIGALSILMMTGKTIGALQLNEAGVMNALWHISGNSNPSPELIPTPEIKPAPAKEEAMTEAENTKPEVKPLNIEPAAKPATAVHGNYIIVGAFSSPYNLEKARKHLLTRVQSSQIFEETVNGLTRIGYETSPEPAKAQEDLVTARIEDPSCWLYRK